MSLVVNLSQIKEKTAISVSTYDVPIQNLINEWVPAIEHAILPELLDDTGNTRLQAVLNLGARELVAGEVLAQIAREPGTLDACGFGWMDVKPVFVSVQDPSGLKEQGFLRLRPYLKPGDKLAGSLGVLTGGARGDQLE